MIVGITCIVKGDTNVFSNGLLQNILTMRELLEQCKSIEKCLLINTHYPKPDEFNGTFWEKYNEYFISVDEMDQCDVIIVTGGFIGREKTDYLRSKGKKVVQHVMSASLSLFTEKVLFSKTKAGVYDAIKYDAVWISPQFFSRDRFFVETIHRCPVYEAPYVWSPSFIEEDSKRCNFTLYSPNKNESKRISIVEPNINMVKTCIVPLSIVEAVERLNPNIIKQVVVFGAQSIKDNQDFIEYAGNLDITKSKKTRFVGRYALVYILQNYTDIILFHQNQCELNYAYFDAAWFGYPIVHNSPMLKHLGFYYEDNNAAQASALIKHVADNFDKEYETHLRNSRNIISRYLINSNISEYERLITILYS